jgi:hypothetical protein
MKPTLLFASLLGLALAGAGIAQAANSSQMSNSQCSSAQLKQMAREARTAEQFNTLVACYEKVQKKYLEQAAQEKQEWERRSHNVMATAAKYPRPVDSARNLYEYDMSKASEAKGYSTKFSRLAAQLEPAKTSPLVAGLE